MLSLRCHLHNTISTKSPQKYCVLFFYFFPRVLGYNLIYSSGIITFLTRKNNFGRPWFIRRPAVLPVKNYKQSLNMNQVKTKNIPKGIQEQVWREFVGQKFSHECHVKSCRNEITVFNFHVGLDLSSSGASSLKPVCTRCSLTLSNKGTAVEWNDLNEAKSWCCG